MLPQHVAAQSSHRWGFEALESQARAMGANRYISFACSAMVLRGCTNAIAPSKLRQSGQKGPVGFEQTDRRTGCQRASNFSQCSALWPSLRPAITRGKKNLSWSRPNRSRSSRPIPVNTNNLIAGPASGLVLHPSPTARPCTKEPRPC